jgi:hypothetical protein
MADDPTLPFSALNQQPGVSGLQDIDLPIGDILDGIQTLKDTVFSLDDLADALDGDLGEAFAGATPIDEIADAIGELFDTPGGPSTGASIEQITDEIVAQTNILLDALDDTEDQIIDALSGELDDISVTVESIEIDEDEIADEIEDELDVPGDGGTVINFDSVFGAVASTIEESFQLALDALIGDPADLPDGINTVVGALAALLEQIGQQPELPDIPGSSEISTVVVQELVNLPGGDILGDPNQFVDSQIDRVTDGLVDDSAVANLEESIEGAP